MAEGWAKHVGQGVWDVYSAGSQPSGRVHPHAVEAMQEAGMDISGQESKGLNDLPEVAWDVVVTMGCGDACPPVPAQERIEWNLPDPRGKSIDFFRQVRDEIGQRVRSLL